MSIYGQVFHTYLLIFYDIIDLYSSHNTQGLSDPEEWVIFQAISAMTKLCDNKVFNQYFMISSLHKIVPFLGHSVC